jgi:hypothetical protein
MNVRGFQGSHLHQRSLELAAVAVDFGLTTAETVELEAHLADCPTCARRAAALRGDASSLGRPFSLLPSRRVDDAVYAEIARRHARSPRLLLVATAAFLLVALLGVAAVGAYLLRPRTLPTTVVPVPSESAVAVATPGLEASSAPPAETWGTIAFPEGASDGDIEAVTFVGADLVGVGRGGCIPDFDTPTNCYGAAWTATSDSAWTRSPDQPGLEMGIEETGIYDLASGPAGIVAIGFDYDPPRSSCRVAPCHPGPGVWRSVDGRIWERVLVDFGRSTIDMYSLPIAAIAAGPEGYVMVGYAIDGVSGSASATAWWSPDGAAWTRADHSADMDVGPCWGSSEGPICGGMRAVAATSTGFVAVGQARTGTAFAQTRPAAWTSPDGLTWTRVDEGLDFDGWLSGVTVGGLGLVAVGTVCKPDCTDLRVGGVAAASVDGSAWSVTTLGAAAALEDVAPAGRRVFALGVLNPGPDVRAELQMWQSEDGVAWKPVPDLPSIPDAQAYHSVDIAAAPGRLVVIGWAQVAGEGGGSHNFAYVSSVSGSSGPPDDAPSPTMTPRPPASPSSDPGAQPNGSALPTPKCPAPPQQVEPPVVSASVGEGPAVTATRGSYTTLTCSMAGSNDADPPSPEQALLAHPGETLRFSVPAGWRFARWEGGDTPLVGDGAHDWPPIDLPDRPRSIDVPVPSRPNDSIVRLSVVLISDDERAVIELALQVLVRVD